MRVILTRPISGEVTILSLDSFGRIYYQNEEMQLIDLYRLGFTVQISF